MHQKEKKNTERKTQTGTWQDRQVRILTQGLVCVIGEVVLKIMDMGMDTLREFGEQQVNWQNPAHCGIPRHNPNAFFLCYLYMLSSSNVTL